MKNIHTVMVTIILLFCITACHNTKTNDQMTEQKKPADSAAVKSYALVNGLNMYYEIHGHGKPLVLIHGGGSTIQTTFGVVLPMLAKRYQIIAVELQAHGHTKDRTTPTSFEQDADDVAALLQQLNIDTANIFGFSNGGNTAMQVAIRHPQLVSKLVLASAFYQREGMMPGFFDFMQHASLDNMPQPLKDAFLAIDPDTAHLQAMHDQDKNRMLAFKDWNDDALRSIKAPTLIINADKDVVTNEHAVKMSRLILGAEFMILPGTHGSYIGEIFAAEKDSHIPALTVGLIEEFLEKK